MGCPRTFAQPKSDVTIDVTKLNHGETTRLRNVDIRRKMASKEVSVKSDILTGKFIAITAHYTAILCGLYH